MVIRISGLTVIQNKTMMSKISLLVVLVIGVLACTESLVNSTATVIDQPVYTGPTGDSILSFTRLPGRQRPIGALIEHEGFVYVLSERIDAIGTGNILYKLTDHLAIVDSFAFAPNISFQIAFSRMFIINNNMLFLSSSTANVLVDLTQDKLTPQVAVDNSKHYGGTFLCGDTIYTYQRTSPRTYDIIYTTASSFGEWHHSFSIDVGLDINRSSLQSMNVANVMGREIMVFSVAGVEELSDTLIQWFGAYDLSSDSMMYLLPGATYLTNTYSTPSTSAALIYGTHVFHRAGETYVGLDLLTGNINYTIDMLAGRPINSNSGFPSLNENIVFTSSNGVGPAVGIDIVTGEVLWMGDFSQNLGVSEAYGDYFLSNSNGKATFDKVHAKTGSIDWIWESPLRKSGQVGDAGFGTQFAIVGEEAITHDYYQIYRVALGPKY